MTKTIARSAIHRTCHAVGLVLTVLLSSLGCGGGSDEAPPPADGVDAYMKDLPAWSSFAPLKPDLGAHPVGDPGPAETTNVGEKQFVCQTTPFAVQKTPRELVMYSPNVEILWPGSLIQGRSYRDGEGLNALLALTIAERTPIKVSIPALKTTDNFREVVPDQATVSQAIGAMVGAATEADLQTPSTMTYNMESFHSEEQFALSMGLSGRYMGFSGSANFQYAQSAEKTTVVVHFVEKMFEVVVAPPQTPRAFFSPAFTQAKLDEQVALGRIGPNNLPVYISNVVYGRMFTFAMTSTKSEQEMRAALQAAYSWGTGNVNAEISAEQKSLIQNSQVSITSMGGGAQATLNVIQSGDWRAYFDAPAPLSSATPLSYTFRSLADGTVALVTETASYGRTECNPVLVQGFLDVQPVQLQMPTPFTAASGDLDGDGRMDLVWNHRGSTNDVRVGFGKPDGTFDVATGVVVTIPASPSSAWTDFDLLVADMNGDGKDDLVWNRIASGKSETWVAPSRGDGAFDLQPVHVRSDTQFTNPFAVMTARVQAKAAQPPPRDLLWSRITAADNTVLASVWGGGAPAVLAPQLLPAPGSWAPYAGFGSMLGDVTGDGVDDLVWGAQGGLCAAVNDGAGAFAVQAVHASTMPCSSFDCPHEWGFRVGDVDGDGKADVLRWDRNYTSYRTCSWCCPLLCGYDYHQTAATQVLVSNGQGGFTATALQNSWAVMPVDPYLRDVSGDGKADLAWIDLAAAARVWIAVAETNASGGFTGFGAQSPVIQPKTTLPPGAANWNNFRAFFGDVNGDGRIDVVLNDASTVASIYVLIR